MPSAEDKNRELVNRLKKQGRALLANWVGFRLTYRTTVKIGPLSRWLFKTKREDDKERKQRITDFVRRIEVERPELIPLTPEYEPYDFTFKSVRRS